MPVWIESIIVALLTKLTSWLMARGLEAIHGQREKATNWKEIDAKLASFKAAYAEAFNGEPITEDQRGRLKKAISDFIRGGPNGGL